MDERDERKSFDEQPIGAQNNKLMMDEYPPDFNPNELNEPMKPEPIPLSKRVQSKVWKIRKEALQQLLSEVKQDWKCYEEFENMTLKLIIDSNLLCQERALKVLKQFLELGNELKIEAKPLIKTLIEKCLTIEKGQISLVAKDILFWMMDHYQQTLLSELNLAMESKNFKIVESAVGFLEKLLNNYGAKKLKNLDLFCKNFTIQANEVRPVAKSQFTQLFKEMFKWMGESVFSFAMHPQVKQNVLKFSKTYQRQPMVIKRGLNEEQKKSKNPVIEMNEESDDGEAKDVLGSYDSRWVDKVLEIQKWKEKKQVLDEFIKKTKAKSLVNRDSMHFITLIKRLLSENNINLLQCGFKVTKNLCRGLKKNFTHPCKSISSLVFGKLKDSKAMIVEEAHETLVLMLNCISIEDLMENIRDGMNDKAPNMRLHTLKFLEKCVQKDKKKMANSFKILTEPIVKMNEDGSSEVREKVIDVLCKIKAAYGMNFFGDKLKRLQDKKLSIIQNYYDSTQELKEEAIEKKGMMIERSFDSEKENIGRTLMNAKPISKHSVVSQPNRVPQSQFENSAQNVRLTNYQMLLQKQPHVIQQELIDGYKRKVAMVRQSSPAVLKVILSLVNKSTNTLQADHIQLLMYHDWKKCKHLLIDFLQSHKLSLAALELTKNMGLATGINSKRQNHQPLGSQNSLSPLKKFYLSLSSLIPKMSNAEPLSKLSAAQALLENLLEVPTGSPIQSPQPSQAISEIVTQFFNVLHYRLLDPNEEVCNAYIRVSTEMLSKGFLTKHRSLGRQLICLCLKKMANKNLPAIKDFLTEMLNSHGYILWQFLMQELATPQLCASVLDLIKQNFECFFKHADLRIYILPLLTCIEKQIQYQRCCQLLDQIVEIRGQASLKKVVNESQLESCEALERYLEKWSIELPSSQPDQTLSKAINQVHSQPSIYLNKIDRLNSEIHNPWPLSPSPSVILKMIANFMRMGEPWTSLACPLCLTETQFAVLSALKEEFIEDNSDILCKWVLWRLHIDFLPSNIHRILQFVCKIITSNFDLHESEIVILLGATLACLNLHKSSFLDPICHINSLFNSHPLYKEKAFRFWINSFSHSPVPTHEILQIVIRSFEELIPSELVSLARFPEVVQNKEFNLYLKSKYAEKLLVVYGFKINQAGREQSLKGLKSLTIVDEKLSAEEKKKFVNLFQRSSSHEVIENVEKEMEGISLQLVMQKHLHIMNSIIMPYLNRELSFINVYNYFIYIQGIVINLNCTPFLLNLVQTLAYFLVDLDSIQLENSTEMLKTVNKILLILLEISDVQHLVEVLFLLIEQHLRSQDVSKLNPLLLKCMSKVLKNPTFKEQFCRNPNLSNCPSFILSKIAFLSSNFEIGADSSMMKALTNLFNDLLFVCPQAEGLLPHYLTANQPHSTFSLLAKDYEKEKLKRSGKAPCERT